MNTRSSRAGASLQIELHLPTIGALFEVPDLTPFSPEFQPYSYEPGMEYLADRLYADRRVKSLKAAFVLPPDEVAATSHEEVASAIGRYTAAKIEATQIEVQADAITGRRAMLVGVAVLVILLLIARWVQEVGGDGFAPDLIAIGLLIVSWVAVWFPIEKLMWSVWTHRTDRIVYERLRDMQFSLVGEGRNDVGD